MFIIVGFFFKTYISICFYLIFINNFSDNMFKKIPNIIHFVYGFKKQTEEFDLYKYIAIKSAHDINKPDKKTMKQDLMMFLLKDPLQLY